MPVQYSSIVAEHQATRTGLGLFDVSHMGRIRFDGPGAGAFLDSLVTRRVIDMKPGQVRYGLMTNESGGALDDVLVYRLTGATGDYHVLVVNASNREKIVAWMQAHLPAQPDFKYVDMTVPWAMIAIQGPHALDAVQPLVEADLRAMKYYSAVETNVAGRTGIVSRTGYTGEDGCEVMIDADVAIPFWETVLRNGSANGAMAAGLGCRDTLRLEAAMPLYGHELNETISPLTAGLDFAVNLDGRNFVGRDALVREKAAPPALLRIGLQLDGKRVPREGYAVLQDGAQVGSVTSGTFSPTLDRPIAMAYVKPTAGAIGTSLAVDLRGQATPAVVAPLPFYKRKKT